MRKAKAMIAITWADEAFTALTHADRRRVHLVHHVTDCLAQGVHVSVEHLKILMPGFLPINIYEHQVGRHRCALLPQQFCRPA